ncbi:MAG: hypothetical protein ACF8R7_16170 [Phycisphaerales bacterium JB039]
MNRQTQDEWSGVVNTQNAGVWAAGQPTHAVEGESVGLGLRRMEKRLLIPLVAAALVIGALGAYFIGGWAAALVGGLMIVVYLTIGAAGEIIATILRRKHHED